MFVPKHMTLDEVEEAFRGACLQTERKLLEAHINRILGVDECPEWEDKAERLGRVESEWAKMICAMSNPGGTDAAS